MTAVITFFHPRRRRILLVPWLASTGGLARSCTFWHQHEAQSPFSVTFAIATVGAKRSTGNEQQPRQSEYEGRRARGKRIR